MGYTTHSDNPQTNGEKSNVGFYPIQKATKLIGSSLTARPNQDNKHDGTISKHQMVQTKTARKAVFDSQMCSSICQL